MNNKILWRKSIITVFVIYMAIIFEIAIFRHGISLDKLFVNGSIDWVPFDGYLDLLAKAKWYLFVYLFGGNIGWFIPFGVLVPLIIKRKVSLIQMASWGFALSVIIESSQYIFGTGLTEVDDVILNTLGVIIGYLIYKAINKRWKP